MIERKNGTLKKMTNSLLINLGAPNDLWWEAILSAHHIQTRISNKKIGKTSRELLKGYAPNVKYLKV